MTSGINTSGYTENESIYGQAYSYTTEIANNFTGQDIMSSGVASYEPLVGGDEISLRDPVHFSINKSFAPNDHLFQEEPLGESLYPYPVVGYSRVIIKPMADPNATGVCGNGKTEYCFYTSKDFPIIDESKTPWKQTTEKVPATTSLRKLINHFDSPADTATKIFHITQGYNIKFNDMHGKLKSIARFGEDNPNSPAQKTEFFYMQDAQGHLKTQALCIDEKNVVSERVIARDIDVTADTRKNLSETTIMGTNDVIDIGVVITPMLIPPYVLPLPDPFYSSDDFNSNSRFGFMGSTLTKVIQEYGILQKVVTTKNGATSTRENLIWDANTGNVALSKTTNHLEQPVYSFNYPAYWAYPQMGHEFKRQGISLACPSATAIGLLGTASPWNCSTGDIDYSLISNPEVFEIGDEVMVTDMSTTPSPTKIGGRFWVILKPNTNNYYQLVDQSGVLLNSANYSLNTSHNFQITVVRPANHNQLNASMGYVTLLSSPHNTVSNSIDLSMSGQKVIDAGAQKFCIGASAFINPALSGQIGTNLAPGYYTVPINPFTSGNAGSFKPTDMYRYNISRSYSVQPNVKSDGIYASTFSPFWTYYASQNKWIPVTINPTVSCYSMAGSTNWVLHHRNHHYSPYGALLQSENAIGLATSYGYSFNHTLPRFAAVNASAGQAGFDSFEDYVTTYSAVAASNPSTTGMFNNDYLGFYGESSLSGNSAKPSFTTSAAHTGRYSLVFGVSQSVNLESLLPITSVERPRSVFEDGNVCNCMENRNDNFNPARYALDGNKYIVSMWVKGTSPALDYSNLVTLSTSQSYTLSGTPNVVTTTFTPVKSGIINGWQKLDFEISIPAPPSTTGITYGASRISINAGSSAGFYLDDFRVQPFNATMVCNVYDPYSLRLCAQLDDNNFATIYEYDREGTLVRKKKETERAIYTLQETRSGNNKR
jgi:hypothetical protein